MRIIFVMGPAFSGKTVYIKRHFPDAKRIPISKWTEMVYSADSNDMIEEIASNVELYCLTELKERIRVYPDNRTIILEHALLRKEDRKFYLDGVREVTDLPVECIVMDPDSDTVKKLTDNTAQLMNFYMYEKKMMEMPTVEEGFASVTIVHPEFIEEDWNI